jgi:hypothetical protein
MAEIKNTFIKSKMNKDLDDRLLARDEYREAYNVNISKSEGEDVGSLENVLGNVELSDFGLQQDDIEITGFYSDHTNRRVFFTATNYIDNSSDNLSYPAPFYAECYVLMVKLQPSLSYHILVEGNFLNFSKTHPVIGINVIEDMLFWTDNRNQPRKININTALEDYRNYTTEETISVAKYYPFQAPSFLSSVSVSAEEVRVYSYRYDTTLATSDSRTDIVTELWVSQSDYDKLKVGMILNQGVNIGYGNGIWLPGGPQGGPLNPDPRNEESSSITNNPPGYSDLYKSNTEFYIREKLIRTNFKEDPNIAPATKYAIRLNGVFQSIRNSGDITWPDFTFTTSGLVDAYNEFLPPSCTATVVETPVEGTAFKINNINGEWPEVGMRLTCPGKDSVAYNVDNPIFTLTDVYRYSLNSYTIPSDNTSGNKTYPPNNKMKQPSGGIDYLQLEVTQIISGTQAFVELVSPTTGNISSITYNAWVTIGANTWFPSTTPTAVVLNSYPNTVGSDWYIEFSVPLAISVGSIIEVGPYKEEGWNPGTLSATADITLDHLPFDGTTSVIQIGDIIELSSPNPYYNSFFAGDPEFLKDKFVRFAYRFKFEDGENSLISPFSQVAFIPKQNGFFQDYPSSSSQSEYISQEDSVGASTIVPFMENKINEVNLSIEMPFVVNQLKEALKVKQIDILYKESDGLAIQIVDSIDIEDSIITSNSTNKFEYSYKSTKPIRTLPEKETTRVSDKVPIRAMTQSIVGNRVVYGNFIDKHSSPLNLDYSTKVYQRFATYNSVPYRSPAYQSGLGPGAGVFNANFSTVSLPNHSLKQNRTYQVGIVLSDKYGRQSDVILSPDSELTYGISNSNNNDFNAFGNNTVYSNYNGYFNDSDKLIDPSNPLSKYYVSLEGGFAYGKGIWNNDELQLLWRNKIPETIVGEGAEGYPGLYKSGSYGIKLTQAVNNNNIITVEDLDENISIGDTIEISSGNVVGIKAINSSTKEITLSSNVTLPINTIRTVRGVENKLGWYSYKIVVKQTEQEYYNLYLANVSLASDESALVNAFGGNNILLQSNSFYSSLISDNINKLSPDLQEVQPEQAQFGTSNDILYARVGRNKDLIGTLDPYNPFSSQFFEGRRFCTVNGIGKMSDLGLQSVKLDGINLGRVNTITPGASIANSAGRVVYNFPTTGGNGTGCKVKVGVTTGNTTPNYVVVTNTGRDYKSGDTITVPAHGPNTGTGWVTGQSQWNQFTFAASQTGINSPVGEDVSPRTAPGIFNASSNPNAFAVTSQDGKSLGQDADARNMVFSVFEIKPLNSNLDIFWETSTSGLVSDLNKAIDLGAPVSSN